jgi:hypothetical protein
MPEYQDKDRPVIQGKPNNDRHRTKHQEEEDNQNIATDAEAGSTTDGVNGPDNTIIKNKNNQKDIRQ